MKKIVPALFLALALSSCAVKTVTRTELFTPTTATLINSEELTGMKYYGSDDQYDYFSRGFSRLRVARTENAIPSFSRTPFNNWQGGKKYTDCLKESTANKLQSIFSGYSTNTTNTTTPNTTPTTQQERIQALQTLLRSISAQ